MDARLQSWILDDWNLYFNTMFKISNSLLRRYRYFVLIGILFNYACDHDDRSAADLVVQNGNVWTGDDKHPRASAFAVRNGVFVAIGNEKDMLKWKGERTEVIDAKGKLITPGFIDCHVHFITGGLNLASVQLRDADTPYRFIERIKRFAKNTRQGNWITGGEWEHQSWGGELPKKEWIDSVTRDNPVFVRRLDGHMGLANSTALQLAGIDENTLPVVGGEIVKNAKGQPSGILKDNAMNLVLDVIPPPTKSQLQHALNASMEYVLKNGVTSVHHVAGSEPEGIVEAFDDARKKNTLKTRIYVLMPLKDWKFMVSKMGHDGKGDEWLKYGGVKGFVDGSLGSHTAAFENPYTDKPTDKGIFINDKDSLVSWIKSADRAGLQVAVHAIGDAAIHFLLNTYEMIQEENGSRGQRFRIEHAQHIAPRDIERFARLNVIPSMQPYHAIDDGRWAETVIGPERIKTTYAFRSLFEAKVRVAFGSDWYVAPPNPIEGIYAAVTRRTLDNKNPDGWVPEQKISVEQALKAYTVNAAFASFDENVKGSIAKGKLADFVILDQNLFEVSPDSIRYIRVLETFVGGRMVYSGGLLD